MSRRESVVASGGARWVEVTPSAFEHEREGLEIVRSLLPDETPYRAWSNFEFRDSHGGWHEVDLLLLARDTLYLVELKHYYGTITGSDQTWTRNGRTEDSPLKLARRKAQRFASKLKDELRAWTDDSGIRVNARDVVPFVKEIVFLHHPQGRCALSPASRIDLYGLPGREAQSGLPGIEELFTRDNGRRQIGENQEEILVKLMDRIGLVQRRDREAGSWVIEPDPIESGDGWQDWSAYHRVARQERARIRFQVCGANASAETRRAQQQLADHEFRIMSRLSHDGLVRPRDLVESELGTGLVYPYDEEAQRLDLWLAAQPNGIDLAQQLAFVRQIAEALHYAHGNHVVHRALNPRSIWVRQRGDREPLLQIGDWQSAGAVDPAGTRAAGITSLHGADPVYPTTGDGADVDPDRMLTEPFVAPEGAWSRNADRRRLDVFALGAVTAYLLTGAPPAATAGGLKQRLKQQGGIDLAVDIPQISSELRSLVLRATDPAPSRRLGEIGSFLSLLADAERAAVEPSEEADPLAAAPGARIDNRFVLLRRLGQGSTAVGLLVRDELHDVERVLKVGLHDEAARRLHDEAEVLRRLDDPRIVKLAEGPVSIGGRTALVLESAGGETLADELGSRRRLSLDRLDRYGTDLLDALVVLDKAGVDHRDIKPSNLGVREGRGDRQKHLVLFDFSLTAASASSTNAGTPPYLDPFFDDARSTYDSAAERYSAAVVLFEMATGRTPVYGDGTADPAVISDNVRVSSELFDPNLAPQLAPFFRKALHRSPKRRYDTAESLRAAWRAIFTSEVTTAPDETHDALAGEATLTTPLRESGLTARQLSAIEPLGVSTVGELLSVDTVALARLRGVADVTRKQVQARIKQWRARLGPESGPAAGPSAESLTEAAESLLAAVTVKSGKDRSRAAMLRLVIGLDAEVGAFATQAELGANLPMSVTPARAGQILAELQEIWARRSGTRRLLEDLRATTMARLAELGGVATPTELAAALAESLGGDSRGDERLAAGLLRLAIERGRALSRAGEDVPVVELRRRGGVAILASTELSLLDVAEALGDAAKGLVTQLGDETSEVVPSTRVQERLVAVLPTDGVLPALRDPARLATLAAGVSSRVLVSARGELHTPDLAPAVAIRLALAGFGGAEGLSPKEVRDRVSARFPGLGTIAERPTLDALVEQAGLGLVFDDSTRKYHPRTVSNHTTGLETRRPTTHELASAPVSDVGPTGVRLADSLSSRSFVALGVRPQRLAESVEALRVAYDAEFVDLTAILIDALKAQTAQGRPSWETVRKADAAAPGSRARAGLGELVKRAWPVVQGHLERVVAQGGASPVVIMDAAPLARYDAMELLGRWTDLAARRDRAVWLLVPQPPGNVGPLLDGAPIPLAAPSQFVSLDADWVDTTLTHAAPALTTKEP